MVINRKTKEYIEYIVHELQGNICVVVIDNKAEFFVYTHFEPSQSGGSQTIDYNEIRGISITDFLSNTSVTILTSSQSFNTNFTAMIERSKEMRIRFSKYSDFMLFSA